MKPTHPLSSGEDSRGSLRLNPELADAVTTLLTVVGAGSATEADDLRQRLAARLAEYPAERDTLVTGLTRCLADSGYLDVYLRHLYKLRRGLLPYEELPRERIKRLLRHGPNRLNNGELAWLALSPDQLQTFRDLILYHFPRFWVEAVDEAMTQAARELGQRRRSTRELMDEIRGLLEEKSAVAVFGTTTEAEPVVPEVAARPVFYEGTWKLESPPPTGWPADLPSESSVMALLAAHGTGRELRFLNAPLDKDRGWSVELFLAESPDPAQPTAGGFAFAALTNDPPQLRLQGRARPQTAADESPWGTFGITLTRGK